MLCIAANAIADSTQSSKNCGNLGGRLQILNGSINWCLDAKSDGIEYDCLFALFHRKGVWGYVRMRALEEETLQNARLRLILGVVKDPDDS
jgi:hypothetical protein